MTKRSGLTVFSLALIGLAVAPAMAQELLINGNFEYGALGPPWTTNASQQWVDWGSSTVGNSNKVTGTSDAFIFQPTWRTFGSYSYKAGEWANDDSNAGIYQQVAVTPNAQYTLSFKWSGGDWGLTCLHEVGVMDGQQTANFGSTYLARVQKNQASWNWESVHLTFNAGPSSGWVTVYVRLQRPSNNQAVANWCDDFSLVAGTPSAYQHEVLNMSPIHWRGTVTPVTATIVGLDLDGVSQVQLVPQAGGTGYTGTILSNSGTSISATFNMAGAPLGQYNLVVSKPDFADRTLSRTGKPDPDPNYPYALKLLDSSLVLVTNGGFETGNYSGWSTWGSVDVREAYQTSDGWGTQPNPLVKAGSWSYREREGSNTKNGGIFQTIDVVAGETLTLSWYWSCYNEGSATLKAGVITRDAWTNTSNAVPDTSDISGGTAVADASAAPPGWQSKQLTFLVPANIGQIRLYTQAKNSSTNINSHYDDFVLAVVPGCGASQHTTLTSSWTGDPFTAFDFSVTGTVLQNVTAVRLVKGADQLFAQSFSGNGSSLTAHFVPPTQGIPEGTYALVTDQAGCLSQVLPNAFTIACSDDPTAFADAPLKDTHITKPYTGVLHTEVYGTHLANVTSIQLVQPHPVVTGDPLYKNAMSEAQRTITGLITGRTTNVDGDVLLVDFDLTNKAIGSYDLVANKSVWCGLPWDKVGAFTLDVPANPTMTLQDPGFESGALGNGWSGTPADVIRGPYPPGDGDYFGLLPHGDLYMAAMVVNGGIADSSIEQVIGGPGNYNISCAFWTLLYHGSLCPGCRGTPATVTVSFVADDVVQSSGVVSDDTGIWPGQWLRASADFTGQVTNSLKLRIDQHSTGDGDPDWGKVEIDDLQLFSTCNSPFADADGDGDVDQADFAVLQACISGSETIPDNPGYPCACFNRDGNPGISQQDVNLFEACATGPGVTVLPEGCTP